MNPFTHWLTLLGFSATFSFGLVMLFILGAGGEECQHCYGDSLTDMMFRKCEWSVRSHTSTPLRITLYNLVGSGGLGLFWNAKCNPNNAALP